LGALVRVRVRGRVRGRGRGRGRGRASPANPNLKMVTTFLSWHHVYL
jgi:hypothetical protein